MQGGSRRGHRARILREHGLVAAFVVGRIGVGDRAALGALDIRWQRHVAMPLHQRVRVVAEREAEQRPVLLRPAAGQGGGEAARHLQLRADQRLLADLQVGHDLTPLQHALDQQLQFAAGGLFAKQPRFHHQGVIEHHQVAGAQQRRQVAESAVGRFPPGAIEQA